MLLYIYNRLTGKLAFTAASVPAAVAQMKDRVPTMTDARATFRITAARPQPGTPHETRPVAVKMPWGKYEGHKLECIPWQYLDRILTQGPEGLQTRDPGLYEAVRYELKHRREWREHAEDRYRDDVNHIQEFDPSGARGR
jgi:hypothetical protein